MSCDRPGAGRRPALRVGASPDPMGDATPMSARRSSRPSVPAPALPWTRALWLALALTATGPGPRVWAQAPAPAAADTKASSATDKPDEKADRPDEKPARLAL